MANMGISTGGSGARTYKYYTGEFGPPLFRFGTGLSYVRFGLQALHHTGEASAPTAAAAAVRKSVVSTQHNDTFSLRVTNHGETTKQCHRS